MQSKLSKNLHCNVTAQNGSITLNVTLARVRLTKKYFSHKKEHSYDNRRTKRNQNHGK